MAEYLFTDKTTYLSRYFNLREGPCKVCRPDTNDICNECWYNNVIIQPFDRIPECIKCLADTNKCKALLQEAKKAKRREIELELGCCRVCIWYEWFHNKRSYLSKEAGIKLTYKKKSKK